MFSHVMLGTNDIDRARRFYDAVLSVLGVGEPLRSNTPAGKTRFFYLHDGEAFAITEPINDEPASIGNGGTIGFRCSSPEQVQAFYDAAIEHGGVAIESPPGPRHGALGALHLAYVRDPDGNKLCALHRLA